MNIKEYTLWLANEKFDLNITEEETDNLMLSFGWKYNQEVN